MLDKERWSEIWMTLSRNKLRSGLTMFGVFWGIFMLVIMLGMGKGLSNGVLGGFSGELYGQRLHTLPLGFRRCPSPGLAASAAAGRRRNCRSVPGVFAPRSRVGQEIRVTTALTAHSFVPRPRRSV